MPDIAAGSAAIADGLAAIDETGQRAPTPPPLRDVSRALMARTGLKPDIAAARTGDRPCCDVAGGR